MLECVDWWNWVWFQRSNENGKEHFAGFAWVWMCIVLKRRPRAPHVSLSLNCPAFAAINILRDLIGRVWRVQVIIAYRWPESLKEKKNADDVYKGEQELCFWTDCFSGGATERLDDTNAQRFLSSRLSMSFTTSAQYSRHRTTARWRLLVWVGDIFWSKFPSDENRRRLCRVQNALILGRRSKISEKPASKVVH